MCNNRNSKDQNWLLMHSAHTDLSLNKWNIIELRVHLSFLNFDVRVTMHYQYYDVSNQRDATTFSFTNLFNSALHVSGDKFAHPHELFFDYIYSFWYNAPTLLPIGSSVGALYQKLYIQSKKSSWGWANLSPETCRAELKRLVKEKVVVSRWLLTY